MNKIKQILKKIKFFLNKTFGVIKNELKIQIIEIGDFFRFVKEEIKKKLKKK